jgi:hypothetical protein
MMKMLSLTNCHLIIMTCTLSHPIKLSYVTFWTMLQCYKNLVRGHRTHLKCRNRRRRTLNFLFFLLLAQAVTFLDYIYSNLRDNKHVQQENERQFSEGGWENLRSSMIDTLVDLGVSPI